MRVSDAEFAAQLKSNAALRTLVRFLRARGFLDSAVARELRDGLLYWRLERVLCDDANAALLSAELIARCVALKSFDYRVLNLCVRRMHRASTLNARHLRFLRAHELLIEIGDDLADYEDDVLARSFNVYRLFLTLTHTH